MTRVERDEFGMKFMQYRVEHPLVKSGTHHIKDVRKRQSDKLVKKVKHIVKEEEEQKVCLIEEDTSIEVKNVQGGTMVQEVNTTHHDESKEEDVEMAEDKEKIEDTEQVEEIEVEGDEEKELDIFKQTKKAAVAVSGGAMVVAGIPLIPFPAPIGCVMIAGGLSVLATEFPTAQRFIDQGKEKLRKFAEYERTSVDIGENDKPKESGTMESLRNLTKETILPLLDRFTTTKVSDDENQSNIFGEDTEIFV